MSRRSKRTLFGKRRSERSSVPPMSPTPADKAPELSGPPADTPTLIPGDPVAEGDRIGPWTVEQIIGRSTGSCLVVARHGHSTRIRATLKVLESDFADLESPRQRLVHEGEVLFPLDHPNIVSVRNLMLQHNPPYLELDPLDGDPLDSRLDRKQQLFMAEALDLTEQLLGALSYLHSRRVYHRDLQPRNLMVRKDGVLTLYSFGRSVEGDTQDIEEVPPTSLPYLAPEWPANDDLARADLYAVGVILFQLLTGKRPFDAPDSGGGLTVALVLREKAATPFLDPGPRFREDLRSFVRHLTTREPDPRPASAAEALTRLQRVERSYA